MCLDANKIHTPFHLNIRSSQPASTAVQPSLCELVSSLLLPSPFLLLPLVHCQEQSFPLLYKPEGDKLPSPKAEILDWEGLPNHIRQCSSAPLLQDKEKIKRGGKKKKNTHNLHANTKEV